MNFETKQIVIFFITGTDVIEISVHLNFNTPLYEEIKFIVFTTGFSYSVL